MHDDKPKQIERQIERQINWVTFMTESSKWVSVSEAARLTGLAVRTIKRLVAERKIKASRSPGNHIRVLRADLDKLLRPESPEPIQASNVVAAKREAVEALALELQAERVKRDLGRLRAEDEEAEQRRAEARRAEALADSRVLAELHLQQRRDAEERKRNKLARQREDSRRRWTRWAGGLLPNWLSEFQVQAVSETVEKTLAGCDPREPDADVRRVLEATIARAVAPWKAEWEAWARREKLIADATEWRLPWSGTLEADKVRAASGARAALSALPLAAAEVEVRAVIDAAVGEVRREIEDRSKAEQARAQAERERQQRERSKQSLISLGVAYVAPYLTRLHREGAVWDEDLGRRMDLENAVRKTLEEKLTGFEGLEDTRRLAQLVLDAELELT